MLGAERRAVSVRAAELAELTPGRTGNLSVRRDDRFAVTPTGVAYDRIEADDVPVVDFEGERVAGELAPSSETPMHTAIYREFEPGAIVHTHSPWSSTLAILHEPIPPVHYMLALAGTTVPVADYATYGTAELAANAVAAMEGADAEACLLANHGLLATGEDLDAALETAVNVEYTARIYCQAKAFGEPVELSPEEMAAVAEKFDGYGQDAE
jgi:L-fuculose-phosphate aldolase